MVTGTDIDDHLSRQQFGYLPQRHESEHSNYYHISMQITWKHANVHVKTHYDSQVFCIWNIPYANALAIKRL